MQDKNRVFLEVCVDSAESAIEAQAGGADRLELCADLIIGGTTPSEALFRRVRRAVDLPIHVMIRPRFGDFLYTEHEYQIMLDCIDSFKNLGADGIVTGLLRPDGSFDFERMQQIRDRSDGLNLTLHRAIDMSSDPSDTVEKAVKCGVNIVLTSGHADTAYAGIPVIRNLVDSFGDTIEIMAGSGVNEKNIAEIHELTGVRNFHLSGKKNVESGMIYRNEQVSMGIPGFSEYMVIRTDREQVRKAAEVCHRLSKH